MDVTEISDRLHLSTRTVDPHLAHVYRKLGVTLPLPSSTPTFVLDGNAWMIAAREVSAYWSDCLEGAWRHAWLLLSEALANEALSPFTRS